MRGFTLLELLVALAIFALLSTLGYAGLQSLLQTQAVSVERAESFALLNRALALLQQDLEQAVARPVRDAQGDAVAPLSGTDSAAALLELTRNGWLHPGRSSTPMLQRIGYRLEGRRLLRHTWPVLDRAPDTTARATLLLDQVARLQLRFLDAGGNWQPSWPPAGEAEPLPAAIELRLDLDRWGTIRRLYRVPGP